LLLKDIRKTRDEEARSRDSGMGCHTKAYFLYLSLLSRICPINASGHAEVEAQFQPQEALEVADTTQLYMLAKNTYFDAR
jgi:hypothetical protein